MVVNRGKVEGRCVYKGIAGERGFVLFFFVCLFVQVIELFYILIVIWLPVSMHMLKIMELYTQNCKD